MVLFTKDELIERLKEIRNQGWIVNTRKGNDGSVGNIIEDLLGIEENNLPIPNAAEWELKTQRMRTSSHTTLFHLEPSPRAAKIVSKILLPRYGWPHKNAGAKYPADEKSFRQTIDASKRSDRGFGVIVNRGERKVEISFDARCVGGHHAEWLTSVRQRGHLNELDPTPYWGFDDLTHKAGTKLLNCFYIKAAVKKSNKIEYFHYQQIFVLQKFSPARFINAIEEGLILVDFDARTGHNHGTKFRLKKGVLSQLYEKVTQV